MSLSSSHDLTCFVILLTIFTLPVCHLQEPLSIVPLCPLFQLVFMSVVVVPVRVVGIVLCLLVAYVLASAGLWGLSREDLAARPISGWRR